MEFPLLITLVGCLLSVVSSSFGGKVGKFFWSSGGKFGGNGGCGECAVVSSVLEDTCDVFKCFGFAILTTEFSGSGVYFSPGLGHIVALFCFLLYMNNERTIINGNNSHKRWSRCKLGPGTCPLRFGVVLFVELIIKFTFETTSFISVKVDDKLLDGDDKLLDGDDKLLDGDDKLLDGDDKLLDGDVKFASGDVKFASGDVKFASGDVKFVSGDVKFVIFG